MPVGVPAGMRKELPNCAILGGMTVELLGRATPEECVERAKALVDGLGALDGGFVLCQDKMGTFKADARPENLKAVSEFIVNYRG